MKILQTLIEEDLEKKNLLGCKAMGEEETVVCIEEFFEVRQVG